MAKTRSPKSKTRSPKAHVTLDMKGAACPGPMLGALCLAFGLVAESVFALGRARARARQGRAQLLARHAGGGAAHLAGQDLAQHPLDFRERACEATLVQQGGGRAQTATDRTAQFPAPLPLGFLAQPSPRHAEQADQGQRGGWGDEHAKEER